MLQLVVGRGSAMRRPRAGTEMLILLEGLIAVVLMRTHHLLAFFRPYQPMP